jgi:hypothetical protein
MRVRFCECQVCHGEPYGLLEDSDGAHYEPCPHCGAGTEEQRLIPWRTLNFISDIDNTEGRINSGLDMSHIHPGAHDVRSRRQLRELNARMPERYFERTNGEFSVLKPITDPGTGRVTVEKVTNHRKGIEIGEIHQMDSIPDSVDLENGNQKELEREWERLERVAEAQVDPTPDDVRAHEAMASREQEIQGRLRKKRGIAA